MINRSPERIQTNGEVFTPPLVVEKILKRLPGVMFTDPNKTFIDPACGDGNFLIEVLKRKYQKMRQGDAPKPKIERVMLALSTIYGVDLMLDNVEECRRRLLTTVHDLVKLTPDQQGKCLDIVEVNIVQGNTLMDWPVIVARWNPDSVLGGFDS